MRRANRESRAHSEGTSSSRFAVRRRVMRTIGWVLGAWVGFVGCGLVGAAILLGPESEGLGWTGVLTLGASGLVVLAGAGLGLRLLLGTMPAPRHPTDRA